MQDLASYLCSVTGLPFKNRGNRAIASCYINGKPHQQEDKTYAVRRDITIFIKEQGGEDISLKEWLKLYGDVSKYSSLAGVEFTSEPQSELRYVYPDVVNRTIPKRYDNNLFYFLAKKFGNKRVDSVFRKYNIGQLYSSVVFWYQDSSGNFMHDNIISYRPDGKRMEGARRRFKVKYGYIGRCVFGAHLIKSDSEVCVVESEKTALIMAIMEKRGRVWVATGGSTKLSGIKSDWNLFPDFDLAGSFWECFGCNKKGVEGECIIYRDADGRRLKDWNCKNANLKVKHWFNDLTVEQGWDSADWVLNNLQYLWKS